MYIFMSILLFVVGVVCLILPAQMKKKAVPPPKGLLIAMRVAGVILSVAGLLLLYGLLSGQIELPLQKTS